MPIETRIIPGSNLELVTWRGELTPSEIVAAVFEQIHNPKLPPPYDVLYDGRELRVAANDDDPIRELATYHANALELSAGYRTAFVVPGDVEYGLVRMFFSLAAGNPIEQRLFREWGEALHWLGLPPHFR